MSSDFQFAPTMAALRRFAQPPPAPERCELCSAELTAEHPHLLELSSRQLVCACRACAILFDTEGAGKFRRVPERVQFLPNFSLTDEAWLGLGLPINLAFFLHSTVAGHVVALYPSPAGATEAYVPMDAWQMLEQDNPVLCDLRPDVEALLVNRMGEAREHYRVGIDKCYELVGLIRTHWRGWSGGQTVWEAIDRFFVGLRGGIPHA
ncbi:MAG TPA: DUF5947 family protein [Gemmataceae bacterium]